MSLFFAAVSVPGNVLALVNSSESALEQLTLVSNNWLVIGEKVDLVVHMFDLLVVTSVTHGAAVGFWSCAWITAHPSVQGRGNPLSLFQFLLPIGSVLLAAAPRLWKVTYQQSFWFFPDSAAYGTYDILAYVGEVGLGVTSILFASRQLCKTTTARATDFGTAIARARDRARRVPTYTRGFFETQSNNARQEMRRYRKREPAPKACLQLPEERAPLRPLKEIYPGLPTDANTDNGVLIPPLVQLKI